MKEIVNIKINGTMRSFQTAAYQEKKGGSAYYAMFGEGKEKGKKQIIIFRLQFHFTSMKF